MAFNETECSRSLAPRFTTKEEKTRIRRLCFLGTFDKDNPEWIQFRNNYTRAKLQQQASEHENGSIGNILNENMTQNGRQKCYTSQDR